MSALRKVLVVDDDTVVGRSFNRVLTKDKGYVVITAQSGTEALEKMRTQKYDLVFTDIKMPGMDGVELAEQVKARQPWTPVVIITGYGTTTNESRAKAVGVADFMRKPLSPEMIEESASHALAQPAHEAAAMVVPEPAQAISAVEASPVTAVAKTSSAKNIALLLAAPLIGLAYAVLLPVVGIAMLAWVAGQALFALSATKKTLRRARDIALFLAAPFIGLVYAVMLPFVGMAMLLWVGIQALMAKPELA